MSQNQNGISSGFLVDFFSIELGPWIATPWNNGKQGKEILMYKTGNLEIQNKFLELKKACNFALNLVFLIFLVCSLTQAMLKHSVHCRVQLSHRRTPRG